MIDFEKQVRFCMKMATGHLRKRTSVDGAVSYQLIVEGDRDPVSGKRERRYKTIKGTKKAAEAALRKMIDDMENGNITSASAMKVEDWMNTWLENYLPNIEATTRAGYREKIKNYIIPELGNTQLKVLKADQVQRWINGLRQRGLSPKTIRNVYNNLNAAMKKAVVLRMLPFNPCDGVELPKLIRYEAKVYDTQEIKRLLEAAKGSDMYLVVLLGVSVGLRRGEMLGLKWASVNFEAKTISIRENRVMADKELITKGPKSAAGQRTVSIGDEVVAALSQARMDYFNDRAELGAKFRDDDYVVRQKDGRPLRPDSMTQKWERFLERNNLPHIRLHDLRHSHATALIQAGVSPKVVQQRLGHADVSITLNTYTHVLPGMDQEAAAKIDDLIFNNASNS